MRRFVAVDLETSGLDPTKHEIIEVGLVTEAYYGTIVKEADFSLTFDLKKADPRALEINGFHTRKFPPQVSKTWARGFLEAILDDAHIVGKNPAFDSGFLEKFLGKRVWHHRLVDVGSLAWGWYNYQELIRGYKNWQDQPPNVERVAEMLSIPLPKEEEHTALGDARWAHRAFRHCVPRSNDGQD